MSNNIIDVAVYINKSLGETKRADKIVMAVLFIMLIERLFAVIQSIPTVNGY